MGELADASALREEHAGKERHLHRTAASTSAAASTQSLDTCSKKFVTKARVDAAVAQFIYATGTTFWVVEAISNEHSEGLGVPLGGSRGPGSASGGLGGLWLQNSLSAQNRILRSNLKITFNT